MKENSRIFIAGHHGMVGSAIHRKLLKEGYQNLTTRSSKELDLRDQTKVRAFFEDEQLEYVFLAAAKVGGIQANDRYRAEFLYDNLAIQSNVIHSSHISGVQKLLFLGSSCIYPRLAPQPLKEEYILTGPLERTNESYAVAKIAGLKLCDAYRDQYGSDFISVMPTNLYGPNDTYHLEKSHVIPALIQKFHQAQVSRQPFVEVWGTGTPKREFLHADDLAAACLFLMDNYSAPGIINIGTGIDITIKDLATMISEIAGFTGEIRFNSTQPDGTPRKLLEVSKIHQMGWKHSISLRQGLERVYKDYASSLTE